MSNYSLGTNIELKTRVLYFFVFFTGVILAITPAFVIGDINFPVPEHLAGDVFCRIISSQYFVFTFSKISVAIVMLLAIDRWYAITKPFKYKVTFKRWKVVVYITSVSVVCCALNWQALIEKKLKIEGRTTICIRFILIENQFVSQIFTVVHVTFTFLIPVVVAMLTFLHLNRVMRRSQYRHAKGSRPKSLNRVLRMCAITGLLLALCWIPNQFFYVLSKFNITQFDTPLHHATVVLAMLNSCVNPWIYAATNSNYRKRFTRVLCFWKNVGVVSEDADITTKEGVIGRRDDKKFSKKGPHTEASRGVNCSVESIRKITKNGLPHDDQDTHIREETVNHPASHQQSEL